MASLKSKIHTQHHKKDHQKMNNIIGTLKRNRIIILSMSNTIAIRLTYSLSSNLLTGKHQPKKFNPLKQLNKIYTHIQAQISLKSEKQKL